MTAIGLFTRVEFALSCRSTRVDLIYVISVNALLDA